MTLVALAACGETAAEPDLGPAPTSTATTRVAARSSPTLNPRLLRRFQPLRAASGNPAQVTLGKTLFFDPRLSKDGKVSCNSCHELRTGGADRRRTSIGEGGRGGLRNAPTVFNAAWHVAQFWDGRARDVQAQAAGPILNVDEMAMASPEAVTERIRGIKGYAALFAAAYPGEPIDMAHVARAIAAFEETLATPSRWDRFLLGDRQALTAPEIEGMKTFADVGCVQCHTGELIGGSMFQRVGLVAPWPNQKDQGRYDVTKREEDRMVFKVPSLRNVSITAPYFHDGSVDSLVDAVRMMGRHQLGSELTDEECAAIVTWLGTLTGDLPTTAIEQPMLPVN